VPELPEVECVKRQLSKAMLGATVVGGKSFVKKFQRVSESGVALPPLPLGLIDKIHRHGKWIFFRILDGECYRYVQVNLGMSGRFLIIPAAQHSGDFKAAHVKWTARFDKGGELMRLVYLDPRGFGHLRSIHPVTGARACANTALSTGVDSLGLGPDMLSGLFTQSPVCRRVAVIKKLLDSSVPIKMALMGQSRLAGLGNIYASEACYLMHADPRTPARELTRRQLETFAQRVPAMLIQSVALGGTSFGDANSYRDAKGVEGSNFSRLLVYGREGEPCRLCKTRVTRIVMAGRATYYCAKCQK